MLNHLKVLLVDKTIYEKKNITTDTYLLIIHLNIYNSDFVNLTEVNIYCRNIDFRLI